MPLNPQSVGKTYQAEPVEITKSACMFFALAVGDRNNVYFDGRRSGGAIAPPMFAAVYARTPTAQILADRDIGIEVDKILHYRQAFHWRGAVRPKDVISTTATITAVRRLDAGELLEFETLSFNQRGEVVVKGEWAYLMRDRAREQVGEVPETKSSPSPLEKGETLCDAGTAPAEPPVFSARIEIPPWQTFAYAEASGDRNPLHVDPRAAAARGFQEVILHGLNTLSLCYRALAESLCKEDPTHITSLAARFSRPVLPGRPLLFQGRLRENGASSRVVEIRATDGDGQAVLKDAHGVVEKHAFA